MKTAYVKAILLVLVPTVIIIGGACVMNSIVDRHSVAVQLQKAQPAEDGKPLNMRLKGYTVGDVDNHWKLLDKGGLAIEQSFLKIDLLYPLLYGGALLGALLVAWRNLGRPFPAIWLISPVAIAVVSDWVENLIQLRQIGLYAGAGATALDATWIQVASIATTVKLGFFIGSSIFLVFLIIRMVFRAGRPSATP